MLPLPASATKGTSISSLVRDPCRLCKPVLAGVGRVDEGDGGTGQQRHVAQPGERDRRAAARRTALVDQLVPAHDPGGVAVAFGGGRSQVAGRPGTGVQPAEPALAGHEVDHGHDVAAEQLDLGPTSIWPWSAVTTRTAPGGSSVDQVGHQAVDGPQLGVVELAEPAAVGHLVDAVVVGVDEGLALAQQPADLDGQRREDLVPVQGGVARDGRR